METMRVIFFVLFVAWYHASSAQQPLAKQLYGTWMVEDFTMKGKLQEWETLRTHVLYLYEDGTCKLPIRDIKYKQQGTWQVKEENGTAYLIIESEDAIFTGSYTITVADNIDGALQTKTLKLEGKQTSFNCKQYF